MRGIPVEGHNKLGSQESFTSQMSAARGVV